MMRYLFTYFLKFFLWAMILSGAGFGNTALAGEADRMDADTNTVEKKTDSTMTPALLPVRFYQKHLSPVLGGRCPMFPSCSRYAVEAIEKHGAVMGWFMACDRLIRCGRDEVRLAPIVYINHSPHTYDTVEENDFWLK